MNLLLKCAMCILVLLVVLLSNTCLAAQWKLDWVGEGGYINDGVEPDQGPNGSLFEFKIKFHSDDPDIELDYVKLLIDIDGDSQFEEKEKFLMSPSREDPDIWEIERRIRIAKGERPQLAYYFEALADNKVRTSKLVFGPLLGAYSHSFVVEGNGWFIGEALLPMEFRTMNSNDRIVFHNTSASAQKLILSIPPDMPGPFTPAEDVKTTQANQYVMSALITPMDYKGILQEDFNRLNSEDVLTVEPKAANGETFAIDGDNPGEKVLPGECVAIWLQLRAPATAVGQNATEDQWVYIKLEVAPAD